MIVSFMLGAYTVYPVNFERPIIELGEDYPAGSTFEVPSIAWSNGYSICFSIMTNLPAWTNWSSGWCDVFPVYFAESQQKSGEGSKIE